MSVFNAGGLGCNVGRGSSVWLAVAGEEGRQGEAGPAIVGTLGDEDGDERVVPHGRRGDDDPREGWGQRSGQRLGGGARLTVLIRPTGFITGLALVPIDGSI